MFKKSLAATLFCVFSVSHAAPSLTAQEIRWLQASGPVLSYARSLHLPIDIVVQPTAGADSVPFAMGYDGQRCKLVLSMRGGPTDGDAVLAGAEPSLHPILMEAVAAHEVAHCWRIRAGAWHTLPAGFVDTGEESGPAELLAMARSQRLQQREEGFADLVALAWTARAHPEYYTRVHHWLRSLRHTPDVPGGAHDTLAWIDLAQAAPSLGAPEAPFGKVESLWRQGLLSGLGATNVR